MLKRGDLLAVLHAYPAAGLAHHPLCDHALGAAVAKWIGDMCVIMRYMAKDGVNMRLGDSGVQ